MMKTQIIPIKIFELQKCFFNISKNIFELLWFSDDDPSNHALGMEYKIRFSVDKGLEMLSNTCDPSTIFVSLPIQEPRYIQQVDKLNYFPSYLGLKSEQRWMYLKWLENVEKSIDIGYVFLLFYGLERHLIIGDFNKAIKVILQLRKNHSNKSFHYYSKYSIAYSLIYHNQIDLLYSLLDELGIDASDNLYLHIKNKLGENLTPDDLLHMIRRVKFTKKAYIEKSKKTFLKNLEKELQKEFAGPEFVFAQRYDYKKIPKDNITTFANYSFPDSLSSAEIPNYFLHKPFTNSIVSLLSNAYENTKKSVVSSAAHARKAKRKI